MLKKILRALDFIPLTIAVVVTLINVFFLSSVDRLRAVEDNRVNAQLLNAQSAGGTSVVASAADMVRCRETAVYVIWSAGTSAGAVTIETADQDAFAGTWAPEQVVTWSAANKEDIYQITGVHRAVRTRISTAIVGGTVSTWIVCN